MHFFPHFLIELLAVLIVTFIHYDIITTVEKELGEKSRSS